MSLTKNDTVIATGAHISLIGHITAEELRAELTKTDSANGFANRFLFMCVKRSQRLPFGGGPLPEDVMSDLYRRLAKAIEGARTLRDVEMTPESRKIWMDVYPTLSEGHPGLLGMVTGRAEAQCLRLALAYALADGAPKIDAVHLRAAIAVIDRVEASARKIFGSALGDPLADEILRALRVADSAGMTRTDISALFKRHQPADRIDAALDLLDRRELAGYHPSSGQGGGRPPERWMATGCERSEESEKIP
jgi:hypothetical protein